MYISVLEATVRLWVKGPCLHGVSNWNMKVWMLAVGLGPWAGGLHGSNWGHFMECIKPNVNL